MSSQLLFTAVFQNLSHLFTGRVFSAMYFGRHFEKNVLILNHDLSLMVVFGNDLQWSAPELIKAISFRGDRRKGIRVIGSKNVILLLDDKGSLWRLINAFEVTAEKAEDFNSLKEECFYEWVNFNQFNFAKVLAVTALGDGFACLGFSGNFERKLVVLHSLDSALEEYTLELLNTPPELNLSSYYLTNLKMQGSVLDDTVESPLSEALLVSDRFNGRTYIYEKNGKKSLINVSSNVLIAALYFQEEKCLLLGFSNGKLMFHFLNNEYQRQSVAYLSEGVAFIDKCCCPDSCLLWSNGINLNHTKLKFNCGRGLVKLSHLKLNCHIQSPLSVVKINQHVLVVTINNVYYCISVGPTSAEEVRKLPQELLSEICKGSSLTGKLEEKIDFLAHYLQCKDSIQAKGRGRKVDVRWEGNCLAIKSHLGISLREELWKVQLVSSELHKKSVHVADLATDLNKDATILIENPFKGNCKIKVGLIGDFGKKVLFVDLGEVDLLEADFESDHLRKQILKIFRRRSNLHVEGSFQEKE